MYFEDFELGMSWELGEEVITREEMLTFASLYDSAPVHADEEHGKNSRFGDIIAPGTMTAMKMWNKWLQYRVQGEEFIAGTACEMRWQKPVMAGDVIHGRAHIDKLVDRAPKASGEVVVVVDVYNQNDEHILDTANHLIMKKRG